MFIRKNNWSLFLTVALSTSAAGLTGCKSMPGWSYLSGGGNAGAAGSLASKGAAEAPRYGAPPSATSTPVPSQAQMASRTPVTPNYMAGATPTSPYAAYQQQASSSVAQVSGMQPQRGFYSAGQADPTQTAQTTTPSGYASYSSTPSQPPVSSYSSQAPGTTAPAAYTASAQQGSGSIYSSGGSTSQYTTPASYPQTSGGTTEESSYGSSQRGSYPSTGGGYPATSAPSGYPSTSTPTPTPSSYPSTGSSYSGGYPSTSSNSATPAPNPSTMSPMPTSGYQTASSGSAAQHYRPGGTSDYSGSSAADSTTSQYGSTSRYPSTYTR